ncbi:MAG: amidohydrolase family protein [Planctomycetota bacterium]|nr:amidohydrolase family protein [Planctomycetota bacterium]
MSYLLTGAQVIDGTGEPPIAQGAVLVEGDRIKAVGLPSEIRGQGETEEIDLSGKTILPGFMDVHVHLLGIEHFSIPNIVLTPVELAAIRCVPGLRRMVESGFTTVRDVGSSVAIHLRNAVNEGVIPGPRILAARAIISQTGGHADVHSFPIDWVTAHAFFRLADGADDCRKAVREQFREGADLIKICTTGGMLSERDHPHQSQYTLTEVEAMVDEAHRLELRVAAHAHGSAGIKTALKGGVDTIEHGTFIDEEGIDLLLQRQVTLVPTLAIIHKIVTEGKEMGVPDYAIDKAKAAEESQLSNFQKAYKAGVPFAVGTDFAGGIGIRFGDNATEIERLIYAGVPALEALSSASLGGARAIGWEDRLGTLQKGMIADIIAVDGDPLADMAAIRKVSFTMQGGHIKILNGSWI